MQLRKYELQCLKKNKFVDIFRFTCSQFSVSLIFSVKYWHLLTISVVWYIPADILSYIWWMIRSNWMLFVTENGYVEMYMPTRLRIQLNLRPSLSDATTNDP